ncbi:MAG: hypothetical protein R3E79_17855 [Caldilineaceae bacterium]
MHSKVIRTLIPFCLVFYFLGAIATLRTDKFYPIDAWPLYVKVPNTLKAYTLRLYLQDAEGNSSTTFLQDFPTYRYDPYDPIMRSVDKLGKAVENEDQNQIAIFQTVLEQDPIMRDIQHYELVELSYPSLAKWKAGTFQVESMRHFYRN